MSRKLGRLALPAGEAVEKMSHYYGAGIDVYITAIEKPSTFQKKTGEIWETFFEGSTLGENFNAMFTPVTAQHVRLIVVSATDVPTIW
jgi:hypothetical protein